MEGKNPEEHSSNYSTNNAVDSSDILEFVAWEEIPP